MIDLTEAFANLGLAMIIVALIGGFALMHPKAKINISRHKIRRRVALFMGLGLIGLGIRFKLGQTQFGELLLLGGDLLLAVGVGYMVVATILDIRE